MQINATITQSADNLVVLADNWISYWLADNWISFWLGDNSVICMSILLCFFIVLYFLLFYFLGLKSTIKQLLDLVFSFTLKMYNKAIIGLGFCDMQNCQCLG